LIQLTHVGVGKETKNGDSNVERVHVRKSQAIRASVAQTKESSKHPSKQKTKNRMTGRRGGKKKKEGLTDLAKKGRGGGGGLGSMGTRKRKVKKGERPQRVKGPLIQVSELPRIKDCQIVRQTG